LGLQRPNSAQEAQAVSTALVPVASSGQPAPSENALARPRAEFLAQLIATLAQAPQTRARRRAAPEAAVAAYAVTDHRSLPAGRALSRAL
jgi:hypothetical protein